MDDSQEPKTIEDLLSITANAEHILVRKRPRMKPGEEWKDPMSCCHRMGITWEQGISQIIVQLKKEDLCIGPDPSRDDRVPQDKWIFKVSTPPEIQPPRKLYIKLSSRQPKELFVESFHETDQPDDYDINAEEDY